MKRTYEKPLFAAEMFTLNQSIALDCADGFLPKDQLNFGDPISCVWDLGDGYKIFSLEGTCNVSGEEACYNNPSDDERVFRS